eukprot:CAMPEP_0114239652 /NCGR_PEP_ID=MMETSP0058-20121206/8589_1 /TAXON_ID=36894 /ORGANISM="Pyramimonas parkeae, CCMP726" /LENGTH=60 /DNA_ID=CAMNT_0001351877 /DNA_START=865 /DNA_END=1047 /DNA_ORIENTATION=+
MPDPRLDPHEFEQEFGVFLYAYHEPTCKVFVEYGNWVRTMPLIEGPERGKQLFEFGNVFL